jgi:hypothetical protein
MFNCEFRMADDNSLVGTKELEALPEMGNEVTIEGQTYKVEEPAIDPSSNFPAVWVTRDS